MMKKIQQNNLCPVQEAFAKCVRSWLESPETIIPDVSRVLQWAIDDQTRIGWHLAMQGYLSKYWGLAVSANHLLQRIMTKGKCGFEKQCFNSGHLLTKCGNIV
jgi:hypothetical protein